MKIAGPCLAIFFLLGISSCSAEITGTVVDAETGKPIEGAVVLVQWTKTKGSPGMARHDVYKIVEIETNSNGEFSVTEVKSPLVNNPEIIIFKDGYVGWRNDIVFPVLKKRKKFENVIRLEKFREEYSRFDHYGFLKHGIIGESGELTPKFIKYTDSELQRALREKK